MAIGNYYPVNLTISDNDLFLGTNGNSNNTVNYTAQAVADYLNTNAKVSIGGQLSFRFDTVPGIAKTISFNGGGGDNTPFSSITQLIVSSTDASGADITIFLNYLVNGEILLAQQNQPNNFGNYKITAYTPFAAPYFYALQLQYIGGNGNIMEDKYYDLSPFVLSGGGNIPTLNQVLTAGNVSLLNAKIGVLYGYDTNNLDYGTLEFYDSGVVIKGAVTNQLLFYNDGLGAVRFSNGTYTPMLNFSGVGNNVYTFQNANGTVAFLSDIPAIFPNALTRVNDTNVTLTLGGTPNTALLQGVSLTLGWTGTLADSRIASASTWNAKQDAITLTTTGSSGPATFVSNTLNIPDYSSVISGYVPTSRTLTINGTTYDLTANRSWNVGTVTSISATSPITSSGGTTPTISTSMATNKLIGRSTAGTGVMEEITIGTGLTLSAGTLSTTSTGGGIPHATASGTDTYTATVTGVTSYADADAYLIRFTNGNTTSATLNINGLGAIPLYENNNGPLIGGDIWDNGEMLCVYNSSLNIFQCIGTSANSLFAYVTNADSVAITKGQPVYAFGGTGDRLTVKRAFNTSDAGSAKTIGVVLTSSIAVNQKGIIIIQGLLDGLSILPTATWSDGDTVYLGTTAGSITNVKQYAPNHLVYLGTVTTASNGSSGRWYVRVQNGYELDELHNVQAQTPSLKDTLWYDNTVSPAQWKTASISTILGYTPFNLPSLTSGSVIFSNGTTLAQDNANFFWNNSTKRLGINTNSPSAALHVNGSMYLQNLATGIESITFSSGPLINNDGPSGIFQSGEIYTNTINGRVGVATITPATALDVNGVITATGGNSTSWNAKQDAITLTTTGTSGAATLVGTTLNIPQYAGGSATPINVQLFTSSGVWTKPTGATIVEVYLVSGAGGGGSGRRGAAGTARYGGGGGASGAITICKMQASSLGSTENIWIGVGGNGGAAVTVNDTNGNGGVTGLPSFFGGTGSAATSKISTGPQNGSSAAGGTATANGSNSGASSWVFNVSSSYSRSTNNSNGFGSGNNQATFAALMNGGYGGGLDTLNGVNLGQNNRIIGGNSGQIISIVNGGAVNGGAGDAGSLITNNASNLFFAQAGAGGGSGNAAGTIAGGAGGAGGPGAGGGGGGASTNGANSGAGGRGGDGFCMVVTYF